MELEAAYVVVGGGIAGVSCVQTLATLTQQPVLLVSGSDVVRLASNLNQLTQTLVQFDVQEKSGRELEESHPGLKVITGVTVKALDPQLKQLKLSDSRTVKYLFYFIELHVTNQLILGTKKASACVSALVPRSFLERKMQKSLS